MTEWPLARTLSGRLLAARVCYLNMEWSDVLVYLPAAMYKQAS
jgi:hypothetical protein